MLPTVRVACAALLSLSQASLSTRRAVVATQPGCSFLAPPSPVDVDVAFVVGPEEAAAMLNLKAQRPAEGIGSAEGVLLSEEPLSLDLGRRAAHLAILPSGVALADSEPSEDGEPSATRDELARVVKKGGAWQCHHGATGLALARIEGYSEVTGRTASLLPLPGGVPPTVVLAGFNMHRMKGIHPGQDTDAKLKPLGARLQGRMIDVCTGLGYTAASAAERPAVREVVTIELDPLMVEMQRANPWSSALFDNPKVCRLLGDATEVLPSLEAGSFDCCVHDPPANALSGELYSLKMYTELRRVLRRGGVLFHYIGDPSSKASGKLFRGITERLQAAGFETKTVPQAFGILAKCRSAGVAGGALHGDRRAHRRRPRGQGDVEGLDDADA